MPDKKPTDSEIVKALEWYVSKFKTVGFVYMDADGTHLIGTQDVLNLINRQKEEIERLKNAYKQVAWERDIFAEDMKQEIKKDCSYLMLDIKTIKAEAYKEFAYELKQIPNVVVYKYEIDNLLKELVGDK